MILDFRFQPEADQPLFLAEPILDFRLERTNRELKKGALNGF